MRRLAACSFLVLVSTLWFVAGQAHTTGRVLAGSRPNIVVIMADDQPPLDGRLVQFEPTVRRVFADHGLTFSRFDSQGPLCCPARAGFYTGQDVHNHGVVDNDAALLDPSMTLATQLHGVGYRTLLVGKYLNGYGSCRGVDCAPNVPPGWDDFQAFGDPAYYNYDLWDNGVVQHYGSAAADYSTDVVSGRAVAALASADRASSGPLFAWLAVFSPHNPRTPAPRYKYAACASGKWKPPNYDEADVSDKPAWVRAQPLIGGTGYQTSFDCRSLLAVDDMVAAVTAELAREGRLSNTLLVYSGDNGMNSGEHRLTGKTAPYETQIPFYVSWPAGLGTSPAIVPEQVENIDFAPTMCVLAGCSMGPYPNGQTAPNGVDFSPLLSNPSGSLSRRSVLTELPAGHGGKDYTTPPWEAVTTTGSSPLAFQGCTAAVDGGCRWHYVEYPTTGERELYDDSNGPCYSWVLGAPGDPCELQNQAGNPAYASIVASLHGDVTRLEAEK